MLNSKELCLNSVDKNMETNCKLFKDSYDCGTNFLEIYKCRYCNFRTDFRIYITGHYKNVHLLNKDPEDVIEYSKIRCCGECDLTTYSMLGFAKHKLNHEQVYNACKCKSPTQNSVTHTKFFDEYKCDTVKYECIECSYKTSRFSYIYKHTKKRHISNIQYSDHLKFKKHCTTAYKCTHCSSTTMDYAHFKRDFQRDYTAVTRKNGYLSLLSEEAYPKHEFKKSDCEKPFSYIPGHFCDRAYLPSSNKRKTVRKNKRKRVPIHGSDDQPDILQHKNLKISIKLKITDRKLQDLNANSDLSISENLKNSHSVELSTPSKLDITDLKFEDNANSDPGISENVEISNSVELSTPSKLDITDLKFEDNANSDPSISENVEISHSVELSTPSKLDITDLKFEDNANSDPSISENLKSSNSIDFSTSYKLDITDRKLQDNPNSDLGMSENLKSSNSVNLASISSINSDSTTQIKKIRSNKKHLQFCLFCKSNVLNFARHVTRNHSSEMMVKKIVSLPRKNPKRKKILELLRKKGNFANRVFVQRPVRNPIINKELLPCDNCYGFYSKKLLWKHRKACLKGKSVVKAQVSGQNLLTNNLNIDKDLKETVFSRMRPDEISLIAKKDPLICAFASRYIKKHHRENSVSCVTRKMRELAKLLMELTKQYPEIENLFQCLKPELFDAICAATKVFAKWDETRNCFKMPTYVSHIRFTIKRCCQIATTFAGNKADTERDLKTLIQLVDSYWDSKIYPHTDNDINFNLEEDSLPNNEITPNLNLAQSELKVKVGKKRILIPWTEEQKRVAIDFFSDHIKNKKPPREGECAKLREQTGDLFENKNWLKIKVFIQNQYTKYRK